MSITTVDCGQGCLERLIGFTLTAQSDPSTATPYSYTDPGGPGQDSYTVVPSPRISFPVSLVRFDTAHSTNILTLCEVFVYGGECYKGDRWDGAKKCNTKIISNVSYVIGIIIDTRVAQVISIPYLIKKGIACQGYLHPILNKKRYDVPKKIDIYMKSSIRRFISIISA